MICRKCGGIMSVKESRSSKDEVVRRRKCANCGYVLFTMEVAFDNQDYGKHMINTIREFYYRT